jgi:tetratricopeptide (TPR) repeat protein
MPEKTSFAELKHDVERSYPSILATVFRRCRTARPEDLGGRHKNVVDLFEVFTKFVCILALQDVRQCNPGLKERLPQREKTLEFLKHPSLGSWVGFLRVLCQHQQIIRTNPIISRIAAWYTEGKTPETESVLADLRQIPHLNFDHRSPTPNAAICDALVSYRNKSLGHGANLPPEELTRRLAILESVVTTLLKSARFLGEVTLFATERVELTKDGQWQVHSVRLNGTEIEPITYLSPAILELSELYATTLSGGPLTGAPLSLNPFLLRIVDESTKQPDIFVYNDAWHTKLEYLSYFSGSYYHHRELHHAFSELLQIKLQPGVEEDPYQALSPSERAEHAERLFKLARLYFDQGKLDDALESLEMSVAYERRSESLASLARVLQDLGEPPEAVLMAVQACLEMDASNPDALRLEAELRESAGTERERTPQVAAAPPLNVPHPTFWDAITPAPFRAYSAAWCSLLICAWYTMAFLLETHRRAEFAVVIPGMTICCLIFTNALNYMRMVFRRIHRPLSLQVDAMSSDRFDHWFRGQMDLIFGRYAFRGKTLEPVATFRLERGFYIGGVLWILAIGIPVLYVTGSFALSFGMLVTRIVDYALLLLCLYVCIRYVVMSTFFVYNYSNLSLKPMLTKINDDGMRSLGPLIALNISFAIVAFTSYFIPAGVGHISPSRADVGILLIITGIVLFWSLGMPLTIHRAARESKGKAVHAYSAHIETAFKKFLDDPGDESLKRYEWLRRNQRVIQRIGTWPLSWWESLLVLAGGNGALIYVSMWFLHARRILVSDERLFHWLLRIFGRT